MSELHSYIATQAGFLNGLDGYNYVEEGATVNLTEPLDCKWLAPADQHVQKKRAFLPKVIDVKPLDKTTSNPPVIHDPSMQAQIQTMDELEKLRESQDAPQTITPTPQPDLTAQEGAEGTTDDSVAVVEPGAPIEGSDSGTGSQGVI